MKSKAAAGVGSSSPSSFPTPGLCLIGGPGLLFDSLARSQQPLVKGKGLLQDPGLPHYRLHAAPSWLAGPLVPGRGLQGRFQSDPESERLLPAAPASADWVTRPYLLASSCSAPSCHLPTCLPWSYVLLPFLFIQLLISLRPRWYSGLPLF